MADRNRIRRLRIQARRLRGEQGSTLVEIALTFFMLTTVVFGIIAFGMMIFAWNFISDAAREGTRYAMVHGSTCEDSSGSEPVSCALTSDQIASYVEGLSPSSFITSGIKVEVHCGPGGGPAPPSGDCGATGPGHDDAANNSPGNVVAVQITYKFTLFQRLLHLPPISMKTSSERVIWQ